MHENVIWEVDDCGMGAWEAGDCLIVDWELGGWGLSGCGLHVNIACELGWWLQDCACGCNV